MVSEPMTILCSGVTLGVYVPALILESRLRKLGLSTDVVVFESLLVSGKREKIPEMKRAYHHNFSFALMARKLSTGNNRRFLDQPCVSALLEKWKSRKRRRFIIWSGFWMPIIEQYLEEVNFDLSIHILNVDAVVMNSFKPYQFKHPFYRFVFLFDWEKQRLPYRLCVSDDRVLAYHKRADRFLVHGGGWGIGTYKEKIPELKDLRMNLDIIAYEKGDIETPGNGNRYFLIDPKWKPWEKNRAGFHEFPPFGEMTGNRKIEFKNNPWFPEVYRLVRHNKAIISKPGGGTLIDSISAATPVIFLEPFGDGEKKNAQLFEHLGFGISYQRWINSGCSFEVLEKLHTNILTCRSTLKDYAGELYHAA
jgi:hypothetical protein